MIFYNGLKKKIFDMHINFLVAEYEIFLLKNFKALK